MFVFGVSSSHASMLAYMVGDVQGVIVGERWTPFFGQFGG
jgi:hypothetical protein